jgi:hypothetical protein
MLQAAVEVCSHSRRPSETVVYRTVTVPEVSLSYERTWLERDLDSDFPLAEARAAGRAG